MTHRRCCTCGETLDHPLHCCELHQDEGKAYCQTCIVKPLRQELERPTAPIKWVVYRPRLVDGEIHRVVSYVPGWAEVQTWRNGEWWDGGHLVEVVRCTPPTPADKLLALGLPPEQLEPGFSDDLAPKYGAVPEPLSKRTSDAPAVKVLLGPNIKGKRICRLVLTEDGKGVGEEWLTDGWYRTREYVGEVLAAPSATSEQLEERGVPGGGRILGHKTFPKSPPQTQGPAEEVEFQFTDWTSSVGRCQACRKALNRPLFCCSKHASDGIAYCEECLKTALRTECEVRGL